ncbi:MAG: potassium channel family protein [Pseudomonadales bacterium]|nr:potassium channel family protein [Pseudomonadales bacterium]
MARTRLNQMIGLAGVDDQERSIARKWGRRLEGPMLLLAVWILLHWYLSATGRQFSPLFELISNLAVWLFFVFETVLLTSLCADKKSYLKSNWMNLLIIAGGIPILWGFSGYAGILRTLRLLLIVSLLFNVSNTVLGVLSRNQIGQVLVIGLVFVLMSGILIAGIDPAIETPLDGIWWAWVTVTTVGYGDIVPTSNIGRMFGAVLILMGVCLFSLLTAGFAAFFISKEEEIIEEKEDVTIQQLSLMLERIEQIEARLQQLCQHQGVEPVDSQKPEN